MDHKVLYTNKEVKIKAITTLDEANGEDEYPSGCCFLSEGQQKSTLLFIGTAEGILQSLQLKVTGPDLRVTMEPRCKIMVTAPAAGAEPSQQQQQPLSGAELKALEGVSYLFALPPPLSLLVVVLGGRWLTLHASTLQMVQQESMQYRCPARLRLCCMAEAQETSYRGGLGDAPAHRFLCVGTDGLARLVELTASGVRGLRSLVAAGPASDAFPIEADVSSSVVWRGDLIVTASAQSVAAYDAISQTMQYRLDIRGQLGHLPALVRCLPGGAHGQRRVPLHFPEVPTAAVAAPPADAVEEDPSGWSRTDRVLFRTDAHVLTLEVPEAVEDVDLLRAAPLEVGIAGLQDVVASPPYLVAIQQNRAVLFYMDEGGALAPVDNREGVYFSDKCVMHRLATFSGGLLCFSEHTVEVAQWKPLSKQLQLFVEDGQYNTAIRLFNHCAPYAAEEADDAMTALYRRCAEHAFRRKRFAESFACYYLAETPLREFLGLFPELLLPDNPDLAPVVADGGGGAADTALTGMMDALVPIKATRASRFLYEAVYNILKVYWQRPSLDEGTVSESSGGSAACNSEEDVALLEYAFFILIVFFLDGSQDAAQAQDDDDSSTPFFVRRDEAEGFLLQSSHLPYGLCDAATAATGPFPRPLLTPVLLAAQGRLAAALDACEHLSAVETACRVLHTAARRGAGDSGERREELHALYAAHLPWMLCTREDVVLAFLTSPHVGAPPVDVALPLLLGVGGMSLFLYLHHLLYTQGSTKQMVHNTYALHLIEMIVALRSFLTLVDDGGPARARAQQHLCEQWHCTAEDLAFAKLPAGLETGLLGNARHQLCTFLKEDEHYDEELVHTHLYAAGLLEERVVLLQHKGDHLSVLKLLVYDLDDLASAERYCLASQEGDAAPPRAEEERTQTGDGAAAALTTPTNTSAIVAVAQALQFPSLIDHLVGHAGSSDDDHRGAPEQRPINIYFHILLHVLLHPPEGHAPRRAQATYLLRRWAHVMNDAVVLETLPGDMGVAEVADYVVQALRAAERDAVALAVEAAAARAVLAQVTARHTAVQKRFVCVNAARRCAVCGRRLREEAEGMFVVYPNLKTAHFRCQCDTTLDPERGVLFGSGL